MNLDEFDALRVEVMGRTLEKEPPAATEGGGRKSAVAEVKRRSEAMRR
jgi:hypothetical protein